MSVLFKNAPSSGTQLIANSRTLIYGNVPGSTTAIIFDGTISNVDDSGQLDHTFTAEVRRADGTTRDILLNKIIVPYNSSFQLPKIVLMTGEAIEFTGVDNNKLAAKLSLIERT